MKVEYTRGPDGLFADERRRRVLAERLASELAHAPRGRFGAGNDFVAMTAVQARLGWRWKPSWRSVRRTR